MNEYDYMEEYKKELDLAIKEGINPALFWAGKMSQFVGSILNTPMICLNKLHPRILELVKKEYDDEIFGRMLKEQPISESFKKKL